MKNFILFPGKQFISSTCFAHLCVSQKLRVTSRPIVNLLFRTKKRKKKKVGSNIIRLKIKNNGNITRSKQKTSPRWELS